MHNTVGFYDRVRVGKKIDADVKDRAHEAVHETTAEKLQYVALYYSIHVI